MTDQISVTELRMVKDSIDKIALAIQEKSSQAIVTGTFSLASINPVTAGALVGRGSSAGNGAAQEITLGSGLSLSGTTLSATGGGSGTVTSVGGSGGTTGLTVSGGPITGSGTLTLGGTLAIGSGGTGQATAQAAMDALAGAVTSAQFLRGNGTHVVMGAIQASDVPTLNQSTTGSSASCTGAAASATYAKQIPQQSKTADYTLVATDTGQHVSTTRATHTNGITVPNSVFSVGDAVTIFNNSALVLTITSGSGVTLYLAGTATTGNRSLAQRGICTVVCVAAGVFVISGAGLT